MTNHTTDTEAEASAAVEIQMMEEVSNSNNANTKTKRLGIPSFSMFNFNGLIVFAVMTVTFIVIAVFVSLNAADRAMMMASQQEAIVSAKSSKAPKASKAPTGASNAPTPTGANVCSWPLKTKLCAEELPDLAIIEFDVCPTVEAEGEDVGKFSFKGQVESNGDIEMDTGGFVDPNEFTGELTDLGLGSLSVKLLTAGEVEIETLSDGVGTFSAANCGP